MRHLTDRAIALLLITALAAALPAAGNLQIFTLDVRDTDTTADDLAVQTNIHWGDDQLPVQFLSYRPNAGDIIPLPANPNGISWFEAYDAMSQGAQAWNDLELDADFEYIDSAFPSDLYWIANEINPLGLVQFDGFNFLTLYDVAFVGDAIGISGAYISLRDFEVFDLFPPEFEIPLPFVGDNIGNQGGFDNIVGIDLDFDGAVDAVLLDDDFERGEFMDSDIGLTIATPFIALPADEDDIGDSIFQDFVLGAQDLRAVATHELGHSLGLCHSFLFEATMYPFLQPETNPYDLRDPGFDDGVAVALTYNGPNDRGGGGLGAISGSLLSGAEADGVDPATGNADPADPLALFLFGNPVFVGVPDPDFDLVNGLQPSVFLPTVLDSDQGAIRLITWAYAGRDVAFPNNPAVTALPSFNSEYFFPGLPPGDEYTLWTTPQPAGFNSVVGAVTVFEGYPPEFYGGAGAVPFGLGSGIDINVITDNTVETTALQTAHLPDGRFTIGVDLGPAGLAGHPNPSSSYMTVRVISGGETNDFTNRIGAIGDEVQELTLNDGANISNGTWAVDPGVEVRQQTQIFSAEGGDVPGNEVKMSWELTNVSGVAVEAGVRIALDTITDTVDHNPFVINGIPRKRGMIFEGTNVPSTWEMINEEYPEMRLDGTLIGPEATTPSRFVIGRRNEVTGPAWDVNPTSVYADPDDLTADGACAIYFDPVPLQPGEVVTFSTVFSETILEAVGPETGVPDTTPEGATEEVEQSIFADDPNGVAFVSVFSGDTTSNINIYTNTGVEPPGGGDGGDGGDGGGDGEPLPPPEPVFAPPQEGTEGPAEFPTDTDSSVHVEVGDVDNDGDLDIVYASVTPSDGGGANASINRLYLNGGFANEMPLGNFIDGTFGRNGVPDGPPPFGDDRIPIVFDTDPRPTVTNFELINEVTATVNFGDFDRDGFIDLFVGNSGSFNYTQGGPNRLFMNRQGTFQGETFRSFVDETVGVTAGGDPRLPGILNQVAGPFPGQQDLYQPDTTFRSDVGDIDYDGDLDIVVCTSRPIRPLARVGDTFLPQLGAVPLGTGDPPIQTNIPMEFNTRILINNGSGFFRDDTLGSDNAFGGRPRGPGTVEVPGATLEGNSDRDRIPPNMWDWNPTNPPNIETDFGRDTEIILSHVGGSSALDIFQISARNPANIVNFSMEGQEEFFINFDAGHYFNRTYGPETLLDPDTSDAYPVWFLIDDVYFSLGFPPALIGLPDGHPQDISINEVDQIATFIESDTWGGAGHDLDNDGDIDYVAANMADAIVIYNNWGGANTNRTDEPVGGADEPLISTQSFIIDSVRPPDGLAFENTRLQIIDTSPAGLNVRVRGVALGDVDLDGDPDAFIATDGSGGELTASAPTPNLLFLNNGEGDLNADDSGNVLEATNTPSQHVVLADVDNDGDLDAVLANLSLENNYLENFLIDGPATPLTSGDMAMFFDATNEYLQDSHFLTVVPDFTPFPWAGQSTSSSLLDLDNDGDLDLFLGEGLAAIATNNRIYLNSGNPINDGVPVFKSAHVPFPAPQLIQSVNEYANEGRCDADSDGDFDSPFSLSPTVEILPGDYDNDGDYDMFVVNSGFRNTMLRNVDTDEIQPNGQLALIQASTPPIGVVDIRNVSSTFEDGNTLGDGLLIDVTGITLPGDDFAGYGFRPDTLDDFLEFSRSATALDVEKDGDIDIFVGNGSEGIGIKNTLLINIGDGRFLAINDPTNDGWFNPSDSNVRNTAAVAAADFNGDGFTDLYTADISDSPTSPHMIWINNGTGQFNGTEIDIAPLDGDEGERTNDIVIADFDGDGEPTEDINGNGILDPQEDTDGDGVIDFFDLNGNGSHDPDYDILLLNVGERDLILINDGAGNFTDDSANRVPGGASSGAVVRSSFRGDVADVDLDGDLDVAIAQDNFRGAITAEGISVQLWINDGTGSFTDVTDAEIATTQFVGLGPATGASVLNANSRTVEFGDVDSDGDPDLFVGNIGQVGLGSLVSAPNVMLINRTIGANLNALTLQGIAPGFGQAPIPRMVNPPVLTQEPKTYWLTVSGDNFDTGATAEAGQGLETLRTEVILPTMLRMQVRVDGALPGPRRVTVRNPDGRVGSTATGALSVAADTNSQQATAVRRGNWSIYH